MLELAHPWLLAALPLPLLAWWLLPAHRERVPAVRVPFFEEVVRAAGAQAGEGSLVLRRRRLQTLLAALVWMLLVVGIAEPRWVGDPIVRTESARDVLLALDLSGSMDTRDFRSPDGTLQTRLAAVQRVVERFVSARESDRVGLVVFGDKAYVQLPFTRDLDTARALVRLMEPAMAGPQTALGDSIGLAILQFESSTVPDRVLILLTDGTDTVSRMTPLAAADIAKLHGIEIHTIGIGDPEATGDDRVDFDVLRRIAARTGGSFSTARDERGLADVYRRIDRATAAKVETRTWRPRTSLAHWPAGAVVLLVLAGYAALLAGARRRDASA